MSTTIDSLEIQVAASSKSAESSLNGLIATLGKLKTVTAGGCGLSAVAKQMKKVADSSGSVSSSSVTNLTNLVNALKGLGSLQGVKISSTFGKQIGQIGEATGKLNGMGLSNLADLATTLSRLSTVSNVKISSTIAKGIREMGEAAGAVSVESIVYLREFASSMSHLSSLGDVRISPNIGRQITEIANGAKLIDRSSLDNIRTLSSALSTLLGVNEVRISPTLGRELINLGIAAEQLNGINMDVFARVAEVLQPLSRVERASGMGNAISQLQRIPQVVQALDTQTLDTFAQQIQRIVQEMTPLVSTLNGVNGGLQTFVPSMNAAAQASQQMQHASSGINRSATDMYSSFRMARTAVMSVGRTIAELIERSNSYVEGVNLFAAALGKYTTKAQSYAEHVSEIMGIDPGKWMRNQGVFETLASGFGVASDKAYIMSKNLTQLGYDLSSFFNITVDDAMQKLQSGLSGELEPLRRLGYDLSQARLEAEATALGITKSFKSMTQAEKSQLRYQAILSQVTIAQGDMSRTLDTPANQLRILTASVEQAARAFGNVFIPVLNAILPIAIAVANAIRAIASAIASLFGFSMPSIDYSGIKDATDATDSLGESLQSAGGGAKKLKDQLADWDELNIIQSQSGGGGGGGGSALDPSQWDFDLKQYDFLGDLVKSKAQDVFKTVKPIVDWITEHISGVLSLVKAVAFSLGAWKIAKSIFPELGAVMAGFNVIKALAFDLAIITITATLVYDFDKKFTEDGDWSHLIADGLTTAAGSAIVGAVTRNALGATAGTYGAAITLLVSAGTSILASFNTVKRTGLSWYTSVLNILAAVKAGIAGGLLGKAIGVSIAASGGLGFAIAAAVGITLTAIAMAENEKQKVLATHTAWGDVTLTAEEMQATAKSLFAFRVQPTISLASTTIQNEKEAKAELEKTITSFNSQLKVLQLTFDYEGSKTNVFNSLTGGKTDGTYTNDSLFGIIMQTVGSVAAQISIGVDPNAEKDILNKIAGTDSEGNYTSDSILGQITAAIDKAKTDISMGVDKETSYSNMLATLTGGSTDSIEPTSLLGQLIAAASGNGITLDADSQKSVEAMLLTLMGSKDGSSITENSVLGRLIGTVGEVKTTFGVDFDKSLQTMLNTVTGGKSDGTFTEDSLIGQLVKSVGAMSDTIKLGVSLMPPVDDEGNPMNAGQMLQTLTNSETTITTAATQLGTEMAKLIAEGMEHELDAQQVNMIQNLGKWLNEISQSVLGGQIEGNFLGKTQITLADLDRESYVGVLEEYKALEAELRASYEELAIQQSEALASMARGTNATYEAYKSLYGETDARTLAAKKAKEDAQKAFDDFNPVDTVNKAVDAAIAPGREKVWEAMNQIFKFDSSETDDFLSSLIMPSLFSNIDFLEGDVDHMADEVSKMVSDAFDAHYSKDDRAALKTTQAMLGLTDFDVLSDEIKLEMYDYLSEKLGDEKATAIFEKLGANVPELIAKGMTGSEVDDVSGAAVSIGDSAISAFGERDWYGTGAKAAGQLARGFGSVRLPSVGMSGLTVTNGYSFGGLRPFAPRLYANGGYPEQGELFVAREDGAEMVGIIGRKTAVANNDQIVESVASGVAHGQNEQNMLLRQQNEYLRMIVNKKFEAHVVPSTALARVNRQAEQMRLRTEGV